MAQEEIVMSGMNTSTLEFENTLIGATQFPISSCTDTGTPYGPAATPISGPCAPAVAEAKTAPASKIIPAILILNDPFCPRTSSAKLKVAVGGWDDNTTQQPAREESARNSKTLSRCQKRALAMSGMWLRSVLTTTERHIVGSAGTPYELACL